MKLVQALKNRFLSCDPFFLIFYVTARCNAKCKMCYYWDNIINWQSRQHLTVEEVEKVTHHINSLQQLTISGGEPFLREELAEICTLFCRNCKAQFITIPTNGLLTDRIERTLTEALEDNPETHFRIGLSMPEMGEELDELYGVPNSFARHQETFKMLKALRGSYSNLNIDVGIVYNKFNAQRVREIVDYVIEDMEGCNPIVSVVRGKPQLQEAKEISVEELKELYDYIRERIPKQNNRPFCDFMNIMRDMVHEITVKTLQENAMIIPCRAGEKLLVIYDNGDLYPCELLDNKLGNIRDFDYDIHRTLALQQSQEVVQWILREKCHCTWECANNNNILFSKKFQLDLMSRYLHYKIGLY